ncbi:cobalt ECF transporter T component CbiQ [Vallitalea okinawensis]|uniref:cobalt ECF transporter T component CbiQ n=1 Tax=Vallitalea okinawensis TaxID=2078660 RepID=UPI000CFB54B9|nr:cobalt ECF transporter T component CbiQ [Vallitalea okinawensis]
MIIDNIAQESPLKGLHPVEKIIGCILTLTTLLVLKEIRSHLLAIVLLNMFLLFIAKINWKTLSLMLLAFLPFLLFGALSIALTLSVDSGITVNITSASLNQGIFIFFRSFSCLLCMYSLVLTTPIQQVIWGLRKLKCPTIICEMMLIIYKYIFILAETSKKIYLSQHARLGYKGYKQSLRSFAALLSALFIKSLDYGRKLFTSLESRGYVGTLHTVATYPPVKISHLLSILIINLIILFFGY